MNVTGMKVKIPSFGESMILSSKGLASFFEGLGNIFGNFKTIQDFDDFADYLFVTSTVFSDAVKKFEELRNFKEKPRCYDEKGNNDD